MPIYGCNRGHFYFLAPIHTNRGSSERSRSPEYQDIKIFEIGLNLTELSLIACATANFRGFLAIMWLDFNIFAWNLFIW